MSSTTGDGFEELVKVIDEARLEYNRYLMPLSFKLRLLKNLLPFEVLINLNS